MKHFRPTWTITMGCLALGWCVASRASEPAHGCFTSIAAALAQESAMGSQRADVVAGYRVESRHHDALLHRSWANVLRCDHPERPGLTVMIAEMDEPARMVRAVELQSVIGPKERGLSSTPVVLAGTVVRLVRTEANLRFDTAGIAQSNGAVGDRVRVRLVRTADAAGEAPQFVSGTVRCANVLEMEP